MILLHLQFYSHKILQQFYSTYSYDNSTKVAYMVGILQPKYFVDI